MSAHGPAGTADRKAWADGIRRIHAEAAGVIALQIVQPDDLPELLTQAYLGDEEATRLARLAAQTLRRIERAPRRRPMLCGACPRQLRNGRYSIALAIPHRDDPREAVTLGICQRCGSDHAAVVQAAQRALTRIWPDLRILEIHAAEGRA